MKQVLIVVALAVATVWAFSADSRNALRVRTTRSRQTMQQR